MSETENASQVGGAVMHLAALNCNMKTLCFRHKLKSDRSEQRAVNCPKACYYNLTGLESRVFSATEKWPSGQTTASAVWPWHLSQMHRSFKYACVHIEHPWVIERNLKKRKEKQCIEHWVTHGTNPIEQRKCKMLKWVVRECDLAGVGSGWNTNISQIFCEEKTYLSISYNRDMI